MLGSQEISSLANEGMIIPFVDEKISYTHYDGDDYKINSFGLDGAAYTFRLDRAQYLTGTECNVYTDPESGRVYYLLGAGEYALASAVEYVNLPVNIQGEIKPKSTGIREGYVVLGTVIDPGYKGSLTVGVFNASKHSVRIYKGEGLFQATFTQVNNEVEYQGHYGKSEGIEGSFS